MAELHPVLEEALAPFMRAQTKDRDAIAAYQETLADFQGTTAAAPTQDMRAFAWTDTEVRALRRAVGLARGAALAPLALTQDEWDALRRIERTLQEAR